MPSQVLVTGAEHLPGTGLPEGAQSTADLLLHHRLLVSDGIQQGEGQLCSDKAQSVARVHGLPVNHSRHSCHRHPADSAAGNGMLWHHQPDASGTSGPVYQTQLLRVVPAQVGTELGHRDTSNEQ